MIANYASNKFLQILVAKTSSVSFTSNVYVGLSTTTPSKDGTGVTEPTGNGYGRTLLGNTSQALTQKMSTPALGKTENTDIIYFPEATGAWGTITHLVLYDAPTGGNLLAFGALTNSISPTNGTIPIIRVGELDIEFN